MVLTADECSPTEITPRGENRSFFKIRKTIRGFQRREEDAHTRTYTALRSVSRDPETSAGERKEVGSVGKDETEGLGTVRNKLGWEIITSALLCCLPEP